MVTTDDNTIGRQLALSDNADKGQRNYQHERTVQTEERMLENYADDRQDIVAQKAV